MSRHMQFIFGLSAGMFVMIGWHYATVFGLLGSPPQSRGEFFIRIGIIVFIFIVSSFVISALIISREGEGKVIPDEREQIIELKAERNGGWVMYAGLVVMMWFAFQPLAPMALANNLLAIICVAELVKLASGWFYLRNGV